MKFESSRVKAIEKLNDFIEKNLFEYSERLFSKNISSFLSAWALELSNFILIYNRNFFL